MLADLTALSPAPAVADQFQIKFVENHAMLEEWGRFLRKALGAVIIKVFMPRMRATVSAQMPFRCTISAIWGRRRLPQPPFYWPAALLASLMCPRQSPAGARVWAAPSPGLCYKRRKGGAIQTHMFGLPRWAKASIRALVLYPSRWGYANTNGRNGREILHKQSRTTFREAGLEATGSSNRASRKGYLSTP